MTKALQIETAEDQPTVLVLGWGASQNIRRAGGIPESVQDTDASAWLAAQDDAVSGLLLLGGGDVNPLLYADSKHNRVYGVSPKRDDVEATTVAIARERGIPIMGICRGAQMINVTAGGTLNQHITDSSRVGHYHSGCDTPITPVRGSRLADAFDGRAQMSTHIHHQAVADVAPGFVATGFTRDGIIECIESVHAYEIGVQFHPELYDSRHNQAIFEGFVRACAAYAGIADFVTPEYEPKGISRYGSGWSEWSSETEYEKATHSPKPDRKRERAKVRRERYADDFDAERMACGICNISRFDAYEDFVDHLSILHGIETETLVALEAKHANKTLVVKSAAESASVFEERGVLR